MTLSVPVRNPVVGGASDASAASVELPAEIFDARTNVSLLHQVVVAQLAAARQGTHKTKTRGEVSGGGAKPYRQKGTGRARQGSTRAPQFTGGGTVHGPQPRNYEQRTPKKMKAAALRGALSDRARNGCVYVVSAFVDGTPSTKAAAAALAGISNAKHVLVVAERGDEGTWKSLRNVDSVHLIEPGQLNTYDVLVSDDVIFTQAALDAFIAGPIGRKAKASVTQAPDTALEPAQSQAFVASDASDADVLASSDAAVPVVGPIADSPVALDAEAPGAPALEGDEG